MTDLYHLQRFLDAQSEVYDVVLSELRSGRKSSHWMWFIFPQFRGLGRSSTAQHFAISSLEEARAYLAHSLLGPRFRECTQLVNQIANRSIDQIFGFPDHLKFRSSMTLFLEASRPRPASLGSVDASDHQLFSTALQKYFRGEPDPFTLSLLNA